MKILIATGAYPPDIGGPATYSELLFNELPKSGIAVDVTSFGSVRRFPKIIRHILFLFRTVWHGRAADIIFAQDTVSVGLPALVAALVLGKPFIVRVPGDHAYEQSVQRFGVKDSLDDFQNKKYGFRTENIRRIQRLVVRKADKVIAPSRYFADLVRGWTNDPAKVVHIYNGVDVGHIVKIGANGSFVPETIMSSGRLVPWKGFAMLIRAMKKLPEWKLEIAGDGPDMEALAALIVNEGLSGRASLLGRLQKDELLRKIAGAEIFALNTSYETFSFQIVEAMAVGAPVIVTRVSNLTEIVDDGKNGLLMTPDDEVGFLRSVERIHGDPALRASLVAGAREKAKDFSISATIEKLKVILGEASSPTDSSKRKAFAAKIFRYLISGGMAAVTNLLLLYIFTDVAHIWYLLSSILSFVFAFMVSFVMQKFFTFQDHGKDGMNGQAAIYFVVTGTNLLINTGLIYLLVEYGHMHYLPAQIVTSIAIAVESYVVYGKIIFKKPAIAVS